MYSAFLSLLSTRKALHRISCLHPFLCRVGGNSAKVIPLVVHGDCGSEPLFFLQCIFAYFMGDVMTQRRMNHALAIRGLGLSISAVIMAARPRSHYRGMTRGPAGLPHRWLPPHPSGRSLHWDLLCLPSRRPPVPRRGDPHQQQGEPQHLFPESTACGMGEVLGFLQPARLLAQPHHHVVPAKS
jgi:hypothetical protein